MNWLGLDHFPWSWEDKPPEKYPEDRYYNQKLFCTGAASMLATAMVHPLDLLKVRIQISAHPETVQVMLRRVIISEGYRGLYKGLTAALFRQASTVVTRVGVYNHLNEYYKRHHNRPFLHTSIPDRLYMGLYAGLAGAAVGNPAELVLMRMMAITRCPHLNHPCVREVRPTPYKSCMDGIKMIVREEGFFTLWRGVTLTLMRSVVISSGQIGAYLLIRDMIIDSNVISGESPFMVHTASCTISSLISTVLSLPIDVVKSWYQIRHQGTLREVVTCLTKSKGTKYLWTGFWPYYMRMYTYTVVTYYFFMELSGSVTVLMEKLEKGESV